MQATDAKNGPGSQAKEKVVCPICGRYKFWNETFRCKNCQRDYICISHQDPVTFLCSECSSKQEKDQKQAH
jgi:hypothetical protein